MKQSIKLLLGGAFLLSLPMFLTSCEDILGEWDKPAPSIVTPSDGGGATASNTYIKYTAPGTSTNEPIGDAIKWEYTATADVPAGTYYVEGTVNCAGKITLTGDVNLILKDGSKLTIEEGITYTSGSPSLKIFAQSTDAATMGSLVVNYTTATDGDETPAVRVKGLEIHGGKIQATGYSGAAAAICCYGLEVLGGKFIMYDGDVTATGKNIYPGIVSDDAGCSIEIEGGTLTATGGDANATLSGGDAIYLGSSGGLIIKGNAVVKAYGGAESTAQNGGVGINVTGNIEITGNADVYALGGKDAAAAIESGGTITISGGKVEAVGNNNGNGMEATTGGFTISGGKITSTGGTLGQGTDGNITDGSGGTITFEESDDNSNWSNITIFPANPTKRYIRIGY